MADDVDPGLEDALADEPEVRLEDAPLQRGIGEPLGLAEDRTHAALEELPRGVVPDLLPIERDAMDRADDVVEGVSRRAGQRCRDAQVVLDADVQPEPRGVVDVPAERVVVLEAVPRVVIAPPVPPHVNPLPPLLKNDSPP